MGIDTRRTPQPSVFTEVANTEAHWKQQRDRWRTIAWVAIALLAAAALLSLGCVPSTTPPNGIARTPSIGPAPTKTVTPWIGPHVPFIRLQATTWQFDFYVDGKPTGPPSNVVTLRVGKTYRLQVVNADSMEVEEIHGMQSVSALGIVGGLIAAGQALPIQTITPTTVGTFEFRCVNPCGVGHDGMIGYFHVVE